MNRKSILVVDDEKNIRFTVSQALEPVGCEIQTAVNGEEALKKIEERPYDLVFLDLKMPGMNGIETLRRIKEARPRTVVVIITAHGTIESAVEAMKLGAVDFIQKPFSPVEIRDMSLQAMRREDLDESSVDDYHSLVELAKRQITRRSFEDALGTVKRAIGIAPSHPEAYNLIGALHEIRGDSIEAQRFFRAALEIDPTFKPAKANLERSTSWKKSGDIAFDGESGEEGRNE